MEEIKAALRQIIILLQQIMNYIPMAGRTPRYMWCITNGHGRLTNNKHSPKMEDGTRFYEWEFNRDVAIRIFQKLNKLGIKYYEVAPDAEYQGDNNTEKVTRINKLKSDLPKLALDIHSNMAPTKNLNTWASDQIEGNEVWVYYDERTGKKSKKGVALAECFLKHMNKSGWRDRGIKHKKLFSQQFWFLKATTVPAVLTENGFYNNRIQVKELMKDEVREAIANAHVSAILDVENGKVPELKYW